MEISPQRLTTTVDIVDLIERNPITRISDDCNERMIQKVKEHFTQSEQQMFIASFYCYLNYDQKTAFVVDFDNVWVWIGFANKHKAKDLLKREFKPDTDYKIFLAERKYKNTDNSSSNSSDDEEEKKENRGGHNKQTIMMTIRTFKLFCLKAGTKKASEVQEYYMKMEELLQDVLQEESEFLRLKLEKQKQESEKQIKEKEEELVKKQKELEKIKKTNGKIPIIYIYNTDITQKNAPLKIGFTHNINERTKPFNQTHPNGKIIFKQEISGGEKNLRFFETFFHTKLSPFRVKGEIFQIDPEEAKIMILNDMLLFNLYEEPNSLTREQKMRKIYECVSSIINETEKSSISTNEMCTQTDPVFFVDDDKIQNTMTETQTPEYPRLLSPTIPVFVPSGAVPPIVATLPTSPASSPDHEHSQIIEQFVNEHCIVRSDVEVCAKKIVGQFRLITRNKRRELTNAFTDYLKTHFKFGRLKVQDKNQAVNGFFGIKLKEIQYVKKSVSHAVPACDEETFVFENCIFSPAGTCSYKELERDFYLYKQSLNKLTDSEKAANPDAPQPSLKKYLDSLPYVMYDTVNTQQHGSCQGYYGLTLKKYEHVHRKNTTTARAVEKRDQNGEVLKTYESIAMAAANEKFCAAKMSRAVKNKTIFSEKPGEEYYFCLASSPVVAAGALTAAPTK